MKNSEMIYLLENQHLLSNITGVKASYAISKNLKKMLSEYKDLISYKEKQEYKHFEAKRIELAKKHSKLDENANPILINNIYQIKDLTAFNLEFELMKDEYPSIVNQDNEFTALLNDDYKGEIYKIKAEFLPENITTQQMSLIFEFIEE